ncbi:MAG: sulfotransferase, partial [Alphaproteobacteria bacterium]|nr:sulfotransferase [Alphaproteobacteria bacterium]
MKETAKWVWTADRENLFPIKNNSTKISIPLRTSSDTYNPFFITGAGRSGTSLVRRILIANTDIHIPPETYVLGNCVLNFEMFQFMPWEELVDIVLDLFENHNEF